MYATINGKTRRRVFTEKNKDYTTVLRLMHEDLNEEKMEELAEKYFLTES